MIIATQYINGNIKLMATKPPTSIIIWHGIGAGQFMVSRAIFPSFSHDLFFFSEKKNKKKQWSLGTLEWPISIPGCEIQGSILGSTEIPLMAITGKQPLFWADPPTDPLMRGRFKRWSWPDSIFQLYMSFYIDWCFMFSCCSRKKI